MIHRTYRIPISDLLVLSRLTSWYGAYRLAWNNPNISDVELFKDTYRWSKDIPDSVIDAGIKDRGKHKTKKKWQGVTLPYKFTKTGFVRNRSWCAIGFLWFDSVIWLQLKGRVKIIQRDTDEFKFLKSVVFKLLDGRWYLHLSSAQIRYPTKVRYSPSPKFTLNTKAEVRTLNALKKKKILGRGVRDRKCRIRRVIAEMRTVSLSCLAGDLIGDGMVGCDSLESTLLRYSFLEKWNLTSRFSEIFKAKLELYNTLNLNLSNP